MPSYFPRLVALRKLLQSQHDTDTADASIIVEIDENSQEGFCDLVSTGRDAVSVETGLHWSRRFPLSSVEHAATYIRLPHKPQKIETCRRIISHFGLALDRYLSDSVASWSRQVPNLDWTPQDVATIQDAHDFASACTSLFVQMVNSTRCGTPYRARLDLSGLPRDQLRVKIGTCQGVNRVPALFTR